MTRLGVPLVSVHFPKSGGTAFVLALREALGAERVALRYDCDPVDPVNPMHLAPAWFAVRRPTTIAPHRAVHGHFHIAIYDLVSDAKRIVMLRHPVDNFISIYYYWQQLFAANATGHAVFEFVKAQQLSLLEVAKLPCLRRLMSETYFGNFDMSRFDVIGAFERQKGFFLAVSHLIDVPSLNVPVSNVTAYPEERGNVMADTNLLRQLRDLLAEDLRFYERLEPRFA